MSTQASQDLEIKVDGEIQNVLWKYCRSETIKPEAYY